MSPLNIFAYYGFQMICLFLSFGFQEKPYNPDSDVGLLRYLTHQMGSNFFLIHTQILHEWISNGFSYLH